MNEEAEKFAKAIKTKLDSINGTLEGTCVICSFPIMEWGVAIPDGDTDALGFGSKDEETARIAFFPICKLHDINTPENTRLVKIHLAMKKQTMCN